jgi:multiple sugar transport system substrate-binding protein
MRSSQVKLGLVAIAVASALTLSGCAGSNDSSSQAGKVDGSTIVLQTVPGLATQFKAYADAYMKQYPTRKVEVRSPADFDTYIQTLATARLSGTLPDVFFNVDAFADAIAAANVPLDLTKGISAGKLAGHKLDDFIPQYVGNYRPLANPKAVTGLPVSADAEAVYYNKTLFDKYGIAYPNSSWTWDDLSATAVKISEESKGAVVGLAAPLGTGANSAVFGPVIQAYGGTVYDAKTNRAEFASPEALKAWTMLTGAYGTASGKYTTSTNDPSLNFASGTVAMAINSSAVIQSFKTTVSDAWDVQQMPTINGKSTTGGGSYGLSIAQTSKNQDAAWAFLSWFYSPDGTAVAQKVGAAIPPTLDGLANGAWRKTNPPANVKIFADAAKTAVLLPQLPGTASQTLNSAVTKAVQQVTLEGRSVKDAFTEAEDAVNKDLQSSGK